MEVEHLTRTGFDHAPILCSFGEAEVNPFKPFKYLKFQVEHDSFIDIVRNNCPIWYEVDPFISFKEKLKELKVNRGILQKAQAEHKKYLDYEEEFWCQKANLDWFSEGNRNTRFFHNLFKGRRKKLQIKRIQNVDEVWLEEELMMANEAVEFYQKQFTQEEVSSSDDMLSFIPQLINQERNSVLCRMPTLEEVKKVVFNLNGDSASGPDGFSEIFYKACLNIFGTNVFKMVISFFEGQTLPKSITETNLVLLPKKEMVANNWYSVLFNSQSSGFLHYEGYGVPKWSHNLNHLSYFDDTIIFASAHMESLGKIIKILQGYEAASG
ncbi:uncharacterized protein LOC132612009 [Lycium barbarum]|uniref:uncharacterized protein LOC132612009 n=1 Tax=Lycium barbarum TaxID=112863 RepID=UPI00293F2C80|nr:uncharacterized protein LOC132612009 [Lycium barbarum]